MFQQSPHGHIYGENHNSKRDMHPNIHCSTIYNSQDMSIKRGIDKDVLYIYIYIYIYIMEYCYTIKKHNIMSFLATWMDLEIIILSEVNQRPISYDRYLKKQMIQKNLYTKQKETHRHKKQTYSSQGGKGAQG